MTHANRDPRPARQPRRAAARCAGAEPAALERLEDRALLFSWTAQEVYLAELVNRARANPQAEAARLGMNLAAGLTAGEAARLVPAEPLALSPELTRAARAHSADMAARGFFDHVNPDGRSPTARAQAEGYQGTAGENIGAGYATLDDLYRGWMTGIEQRKNLLSLHSGFDATFHYDHLGPGFALGVSGAAYTDYFTADFGNPAQPARRAWLVGVAYSDVNASASYDVNEGLGGVRVDVFAGAATGRPVATYTTDAAGNYQLPLTPGQYSVVFTLVSSGAAVTKTASVGAQNVKLDARASELVATVPDDHADAGDWSGATPLLVDPATGGTTAGGSLERDGDTDLFRFTAARSGPTRFTSGGAAGLATTLRVFSASGTLLGSGSGGPFTVALAAGATYYMLVGAAPGSSAGTGGFGVTVEGPPDDPAPDPGPSDAARVADGAAVVPVVVSGREAVAFVSAAGRATYAERDGAGAWSRVDLQGATGSPGVTGELRLWQDRRDGYVYAAGVSAGGVILYKRDPQGAWSYRNLTGEIRVSTPIVSNLAVFHDGEGLTQIAGLNADGRMVTYWQTGLVWPGHNYRYFYTDLAARDLAWRGMPMPSLRPAVTPYVTQKNSLNIVAVGDDGHVYLFYRPGGGRAKQLWNWADLTVHTGAAPFAGPVTAYETTTRVVNIAGVDGAGNAWVITWSAADRWTSRNVTAALTGAPALEPGSLAGFANRGGVGFIAGRTAGGDVVLYRYQWKDGGHTWAFASVSAAAAGAPALTASLRVSFNAGAITIAGATADGRAARWAYVPGQTWAFEDLSTLLDP